MASKYENYIENDDQGFSIYESIWVAQTFTVGAVGHTVTSVKLKLNRWGTNPSGTATIGIRETDVDGKPTGADKTSGTILITDISTTSTWYEISMTEYELSPNTKYAIVVRHPDGGSQYNRLRWRHDATSPTYADGTFWQSTNSGISWPTTLDYDFMFEVWGNPIGGAVVKRRLLVGVGL